MNHQLLLGSYLVKESSIFLVNLMVYTQSQVCCVLLVVCDLSTMFYYTVKFRHDWLLLLVELFSPGHKLSYCIKTEVTSNLLHYLLDEPMAVPSHQFVPISCSSCGNMPSFSRVCHFCERCLCEYCSRECYRCQYSYCGGCATLRYGLQ